MDGVILEPTLYVDGDKRIEHGRFLRPVDRPLEDKVRKSVPVSA
jgi:hypothetical protein